MICARILCIYRNGIYAMLSVGKHYTIITESHLRLRQKKRVKSAHICIRYVRYAVYVDAETEKTSQFPEELGSMKQQLDDEKSKYYNLISKRDEREKRKTSKKAGKSIL